MWLELATSILGGGVTGILGSSINAFTSYKMQKMKNDHDINMAKVNMELEDRRTANQVKLAEVKIDGQIQVAETEALKESYKDLDNREFDSSYMQYLMQNKWTKWIGAIIAILFAFVDFLKSSARPVLTYYLIIMSTWITSLAWSILRLSSNSSPLTITQSYELFTQVIHIVLYLTVSCVTWWFSDRRMGKFLTTLNMGSNKK